MPFLFPDEKVGYRDAPGQPWEVWNWSEIDRSYVGFLTACQVLVEYTYEYDKYLIHPVDRIPNKFHISPRFIRVFWNINCGTKPKWVVDNAARVDVIYVVKDLESRVRECGVYAKRPVNAGVSEDLLSWAAAVTPQSVEPSAGVLWPAMTPPRKTGGGGSTRVRADRINRKPHM
ncbi:hypothetical protein C8J57DRAFT_1240727 [Mycena rebaudengoi]|nr:hypothetical protein C8J57DRAFT_1240727 [Mycena rebaudengoi]